MEIANYCSFCISDFRDLTNPLTNHNWFNISGCHRFDQSALSLLMGNSYKYKFKRYIDLMAKGDEGDFVRVARDDQFAGELRTCKSVTVQNNKAGPT